jgi:hypothetical protein
MARKIAAVPRRLPRKSGGRAIALTHLAAGRSSRDEYGVNRRRAPQKFRREVFPPVTLLGRLYRSNKIDLAFAAVVRALRQTYNTVGI